MKHEQTEAKSSREIKYRPLELDSFTWDKRPSSDRADLGRSSLKQSVGKYWVIWAGHFERKSRGDSMNKLKHDDHCPTCGKYVSPELNYGDYDWTHRTPHFTIYCDDFCADLKRAEVGHDRVLQMEIDNGHIWDNGAAA